MNKKITTILVVLSIVIISVPFLFGNKKEEGPVTFISSGTYRALTIDEIIDESELIVVGRINTTLPSLWMSPGGKRITDASPREIFEADGLFTDSLFAIEQIIKGEDVKGVIRIRSFVGETSQVRWVDDTQPSYKREQLYLLFLKEDNGPAAQVGPGYYKAVNALQGVYELFDSKAISINDEWVLEELIAYIEKKLSSETLSPTLTITPVDLFTETPIQLPVLTETLSPAVTPTELLTETPTDLPTQTPTPTETASPTP